MEIICRAKRKDTFAWIKGYYAKAQKFGVEEEFDHFLIQDNAAGFAVPIIPSTLGYSTGVTDKNGKIIFTGDIVQYQTDDDFDCQSVVKLGEYEQDGSGGEYKPRRCLGFYVEVNNFTCPDWAADNPFAFDDYLKQQGLLEVAKDCEIIGNIHDNMEILSKR